MATKKTLKKAKGIIVMAPFHERFEINVGISEVKQRFMQRVCNYIFRNYFEYQFDNVERHHVLWQVANDLGERFQGHYRFEQYVGVDFYRYLQALESAYKALKNKTRRSELSNLIALVIGKSEIDLGVEWKPPIFVRKGARLLDVHLVNEPLRWLSDKKYKTVFEPFEKGLRHFLEADKKPYVLTDVVTDMYESIEALAKVVTQRPSKDLSSNAELFIKTVKASASYRQILKDYISYANQFRHAPKQEGDKPTPSIDEVESFVYLTGLIIRLVIQTEKA